MCTTRGVRRWWTSWTRRRRPSERSAHRRRIKTEAKAKVVAAVWGTEINQYLATPVILYQDDFEE